MKQIQSVIIIMLWFSVAGAVTAQKAEALLDKAAAAYESSNGLKASFAANIRHEKQGVSESFEGTIQMKGNKFVLITPDTRTWYDGTTQWTYVVRTDEVNLSNPTGDELEFTNPMTLLRSYKKGFTLSYIGQSTSDSGKMADDVRLTSKKNGDVAKVEVQIERATSLPVRLTVTLKNGMCSVIRIRKMQTGISQPEHIFRFNPADYPGVTEIDLR